MTVSHSERLRRKIELVLPEFASASTAIVEHPRFAEIFPEFLVTVHWMIRGSVPLMETAVARCRRMASTDAVAAAMIPYLEQHIKEELHHDEWLLEDLEVLGLERSEVLARMPSATVASLVGAQYYWIFHHHPVAKLGHVAVMEGYPATVEAIELMVELSGLPRSAFRTLEKHCHLDPHHRDDLNAALDALPLEDAHHEMLGISALHTIQIGSRAYREVVDRFDERG
ncbi:MAG: iron-containing redox enzyme family protein [Planctomycetes bacterium]|nr:iron-containing redox enzyme family protein [Planctomycetota bacterium]